MRQVKQIWVLGLVLGVVSLAEGQLIVHDPINAVAHRITAFQQTLNTVEAFFHSSQWILDLTSYSDTGLGGSFEEDLNALLGAIGETQLILWEARAIIADIERLFGLEGAPDSMQGLHDRLREIQFWQYERKRRVQEIQSLPGRIERTVHRIFTLWGRIVGIAGDKQGFQQVQAQLQQIQHLEAQSQVVAASFYQVALTESMEQPLIAESLRRINEQIYATVPRR